MADSGIEVERMEVLDPESEFLASNRETGNEWELFKENVRPLKRGRKVEILNDALKAQTDNQLKKSLFEQRRSFSSPRKLYFVLNMLTFVLMWFIAFDGQAVDSSN